MAEINYPDLLNEYWERAITPRKLNAPTVISTFAGGGGSLTGYLMAGYKDLLAIEWDDNAVKTLRLNWPDLNVYHGDIRVITSDDILRETGLRVGDLDVLDGSPPCQGFSKSGKREYTDKRNQLYVEYIRLLKGLQPKVFVMENVPGLVEGKMKLIFADIMKALKGCGYKVKCVLLNAVYFNVPQFRERLIWIGVRDDLGMSPVFPNKFNKLITVMNAWDNLQNNQDAPELSPLFKNHWKKAHPGGVIGNFQSTKKLMMNKPANTLTKSEGYGGVYHPLECRGITTDERKRLASFPDEYKFINWKSAVYCIGNSVPPLFMQAIAETIRTEILQRWHDMTGREPVLLNS